jgi:hypothetical protein
MSNNAMTPSFRSPIALSLLTPQLPPRRSTTSLPAMHGNIIINKHANEEHFTRGDDHITQVIELSSVC